MIEQNSKFSDIYLSESQCRSINSEIEIINNSLEDNAFQEIVLHRYMEHFDLHYCHFADQASENRLVNIHKSAGDNSVIEIYKENEKDCLYKDDSLHLLTAVTTIHLDLDRWDILKEINPLYHKLSKVVPGFEIISAIHTDLTGLIGIKFDAEPLQQEKVAEHKILSPFLINAYYMHRKLTMNKSINTYFINLIEAEEGRAFALFDSTFRMIVSGKKFRQILKAAGMSVRGIQDLLNGRFSLNLTNTSYKCLHDKSIKTHNGISIIAETVFIENSPYFKVTLREKNRNPIFTPREKGILLLLHCGFTNKEISNQLGISSETVKRHLYNLFRKTGSRNRTELSHIIP